MDLEHALAQFDTAEANLRRLEKVWAEMEQLIPQEIAFIDGGPEGRRYRELARAFEAIVGALPAIGDYVISAVPWDLDSIGQARLDAAEIGEFEAELSVQRGIEEPGREIDEYRTRLLQTRRDLVRDHLVRLVSEIDTMLRRIEPLSVTSGGGA